jgi:16S rRNA (guanine527-N7)-methyltransferase
MDNTRLAELLQPFLAGVAPAPKLLDQLQLYLDLLLRWNARVNLTAVRDPEQIVTRHFGESLFAAQALGQNLEAKGAMAKSLADVGSGAGVPGIPSKLSMPTLKLTLIESQNKKATFLREVLRTLNLTDAEVFCGRAEQWEQTADIVTLRAVEQFGRTLPIAANLVSTGGRLCLLISARQFHSARAITPEWRWAEPMSIPDSDARVVTIAQRSR